MQAAYVQESTTTASPLLVEQTVVCTLIDIAEICYRIQYPIRNNRNRGDPFSMRQIGIGQRFHGPQDSTWIILQPGSEVLSRLKLAIDKSEYLSAQEEDPMFLHIIFLEYQIVNWNDYVEHLRVTLEPLVCLASVPSMLRLRSHTKSD